MVFYSLAKKRDMRKLTQRNFFFLCPSKLYLNVIHFPILPLNVDPTRCHTCSVWMWLSNERRLIKVGDRFETTYTRMYCTQCDRTLNNVLILIYTHTQVNFITFSHRKQSLFLCSRSFVRFFENIWQFFVIFFLKLLKTFGNPKEFQKNFKEFWKF